MDGAPDEDTFAEIEQRFRAMHHASRHDAPLDERKRRVLLERLRDVVANHREGRPAVAQAT